MRERLADRPFFAAVSRRLATPEALAALFIAGWLLRLLIARNAGSMQDDIDTIRNWVVRLVERGPGGFYPQTPGDTFFVDYPPGALYAWWGIGRFAGAFTGRITDTWLKMPGILGDIALAAAVSVAAGRLADKAPARIVPAHVAGAVAVLLNPGFIYLSSVWGQIDSVLAALVVGSLVLLGTGPRTIRRDIAGVVVLGAAFATKPQAAFVAPVVAIVLVWRYATRGSAPLDARAILRGGVYVAALGGLAAAVVFLLFAPFRLAPTEVIHFYRGATSHYPYTGLFAFNLWGAVVFWRHGTTFWTPDSGPDALRIAGIPALYFGMGLCAALILLVAIRTWIALRRGADEGRTLFFGSMVVALLVVTVVTRVHERYIFVPIAIGAVFVTSRLPRLIYAAASIAYLGITWFALVYWNSVDKLPVQKLGPLYDAVFGTVLTDARLRVYSAILAIGAGLIALLGWRIVRERPAATPSVPS